MMKTTAKVHINFTNKKYSRKVFNFYEQVFYFLNLDVSEFLFSGMDFHVGRVETRKREDENRSPLMFITFLLSSSSSSPLRMQGEMAVDVGANFRRSISVRRPILRSFVMLFPELAAKVEIGFRENYVQVFRNS